MQVEIVNWVLFTHNSSSKLISKIEKWWNDRINMDVFSVFKSITCGLKKNEMGKWFLNYILDRNGYKLHWTDDRNFIRSIFIGSLRNHFIHFIFRQKKHKTFEKLVNKNFYSSIITKRKKSCANYCYSYILTKKLCWRR